MQTLLCVSDVLGAGDDADVTALEAQAPANRDA